MSQELVVEVLSYVVPMVGVVVAFWLMKLLGVFRKGGGLSGAPVRESGPWGVSMLWALGVLVGYFVAIKMALSALPLAGVKMDMAKLSAGDMVTLQALDAAVKLVLFVVLVAVLGRLMMGRLKGWGLGISQLPRGVKAGVVAMAVVYPLLLLVNFLVENGLRLFNRQIVEHETFELLKQGLAVWQKVVLFVAAAIVAPLFEELFFRGMLQTALVQDGWGFLLAGRRFGYRPTVTQRWIAIVVTAFLFAGVHGSLTNFPVLFVLGVGLGYVYERTGILWSAMVLHALFNTVNLAGFFLWGEG